MYVILTTSRKPSQKTRSLAKALARFMNWRYVNRGKLSLEDLFEMCDENLIILKEIKGNPSILDVIDVRSGKVILRLRFNVSNIVKVKMDDSPVVFVGKPPFDPLIFGAIPHSKAGLKLARKIDSIKRVFVRRQKGWIVLEFRYGDVLVFKMKIKESGLYE
jgi:U3 small nucleolar ribonucleoprotein protein IMP4